MSKVYSKVIEKCDDCPHLRFGVGVRSYCALQKWAFCEWTGARVVIPTWCPLPDALQRPD